MSISSVYSSIRFWAFVLLAVVVGWTTAASAAPNDLDMALESAHSNLVNRFMGADGLLRGWEAPDPTPRDCAEGRPSYIGWATPVENAPMFTGLWMPAVCERARRTGRKDDRELARRMAAGLLKVASVSDVKGFIARGTATDGKSHYPWGSTDQTGPWYLGLYAYLQSDIPTIVERRQIAAKVTEVTDALEARAWKLPCDGVFKDRETCGNLKNETEGRYRETSQYLFMLKAAAVMTGDARWEKRFRAELNGRPDKCRLTRLQILEEGYAIDLPYLNVEPLLLWIYVHQHVMHAELVRLETDAKIRRRMKVGLVRDARRAAWFIDVPQMPPRVREVPYSAADWSKFVTWSPQKTMMEAKHVAWTLTAEGRRRKGEERAAVQLPLSAAVIAAYSGDAAARNLARRRIVATDFSALNLSDFFLAEVWAYACRHAAALDPPADGEVRCERTTHGVRAVRRGRTLWEFSTDGGKPCVHPLCVPDGTVVTDSNNADHPWHRGLWFSWKFLNGVNYWEVDAYGRSAGEQRVVAKTVDIEGASATVRMNVNWGPRAEQERVLLEEKREIVFSAPGADGGYTITWKAAFTARERTTIDRTPPVRNPKTGVWSAGYAGFSLRLADFARGYRLTSSSGAVRQDEVMEREHDWIDYASPHTGEGVRLEILKAPGRRVFYHWQDHRFTNLSPVYDGPLVLEKGETLELAYRATVHAAGSAGLDKGDH